MSSMKTLAALTALALGAGLGLAATAQTGLPAVQRSGSVEYLSGGIGSDEAQAFRSASPRWPLTLEFAVNTQPRADHAADVKVTVRDAHNAVALLTTSTGPFLLVRLPPGQYSVDAQFAGKTIRQKVTVTGLQPARAMFVWPAGQG